MPLVDRAQVEVGLQARVVEVVLLVELGDEAVGAGAIAVELAVTERCLGSRRLGYAPCASSGCRRSGAASSSTSRQQVQAALGELDGAAAALVYVPHTTAGVTINEHADPAVARDFEAALERIVSEDWPWQHIEEGEENAPDAHPRRASWARRARAGERRPARARHLAGHLPLRVRRPARALGLRERRCSIRSRPYPRRWPRRSRRDEELELHVDSLAYGGNGVARLNGFVVFVRRGLPGDLVRARVTKVKRGFAEALVTEVLEPSPQRVEAPCAHYPACGGCRFQDLAYEVQVAAKEAQVRDALDADRRHRGPAARADRPRRVAVPLPQQARVLVHATPAGPALGFHKAGRWDEVLEVERCWLTTDLGNAIRNAVRDWAREEGLEAYYQEDGSGYLRHLVVREGRNTGRRS